jgi:hypothetical protein
MGEEQSDDDDVAIIDVFRGDVDCQQISREQC